MTTQAAPAPHKAASDMTAIFARSLASATRDEAPYRHWTLTQVFDETVVDALCGLPFPAPSLDGVSGARELHNNTRQYFDAANNAAYPVCGEVASVFQSPEVVGMIAKATGSDLDGTYLRIEYAQDLDGFWLKPHTDLGVKKLTMLYYLADAPGQADLGTDIYAAEDAWAKRSAFERNTALVFVPSSNTWHGFEPRPIAGVRKSVIINYVTDEWRAREQLAYPATPVHA